MIGTVAVCQGLGPQQLAHTVWPPALNGIALGKQVVDRPLSPNEHGALTQKGGTEDIAIALEAGAGEIGITQKGEGFDHSAHGRRDWQGPKGGGIRQQSGFSNGNSMIAAIAEVRRELTAGCPGAEARPMGGPWQQLRWLNDGFSWRQPHRSLLAHATRRIWLTGSNAGHGGRF